MQRPRPQLGTERDVLGRRILAWLVDTLVIVVVGGVIVGVLGAVGGRIGTAIATVPTLVVALAYYIYLEGTYGQTLGKKAVGLVVAKADGSDCDFTASAIRNVLRIVDNLIPVYLLGVVAILLTDRNQRVGDIAADTVVVRARPATATEPRESQVAV